MKARRRASELELVAAAMSSVSVSLYEIASPRASACSYHCASTATNHRASHGPGSAAYESALGSTVMMSSASLSGTSAYESRKQ